MKDILTEEELCPISGYYTRDGLKGWLNSNAIAFVVAKSGWPRVHRKGLERALGVADELVQSTDRAVEFNFDALR